MAFKFRPIGQDRNAREVQKFSENPEFPVITLSDTKVAPNNPQDGEIRFDAQGGILGVAVGFYGYHSGGWNFIV